MLIPADTNQSECFYCQKIKQLEKDYPLRRGKYSFEGLVYRCLWHSRFTCSKCGKETHFSYLYWCPSSNEAICGKCNKPTFFSVKFWDKTYAYAFDCKECGIEHYDLLYSEYTGDHPWQIETKKLYNSDNILKAVIEDRFPWEPLWRPAEKRAGEKISVEEALKIENNVHKIVKEFPLYQLHSEITPDEDVKFEDTKKRWETTSKTWIEIYEKQFKDKGDKSRQFIIDPALWKQIGDVKGLKVLDAGCGSGYLVRQLATKGADVTGIDFSNNFITYCRKMEREESLGCNYIKGSLTDMHMIEDESFNLVVSNVVLVDVQDYKKAFDEINRVLKPKGRFVWSNLHPIFGSFNQFYYRVPFDTQRNEERLMSMIDRYFDSGAVMMSWGKIKPIWQFHRTLQEYTQALSKSGFLIREIIEPKASIEDTVKNPRTLAFDSDRIPFFIIYDCVKAD